MNLWWILAFMAISGLVYLYDRKRPKSLYPLLPKTYNFAKRRITLRRVLELLDERQAKILVETGIARKGLESVKTDGASTIVFGQWAKNNDAYVYSVDIDPKATKMASEAVDRMGLSNYVTAVTSDSVAYLESFDQKVDFLYLDSYDFPKRDLAVQRLSQEHHLKEFKAIEDRLHDKSVVLIDDCGRRNGGKGKLVIAYMKSKGWRVELNRYQVLLVR